jgi:hypothetical protein
MYEDSHLEADYEDRWIADTDVDDSDWEDDYSDLAYEGSEHAEFDW